MGALFIISGPSGVGKGTLVQLLLKEDKELALSISCTTRAPRPGEQEGKHYFFISKEEFLRRLENDGMLEYDEHFGNFYGTPKDFVNEQLKTKSVILEIDVVGGFKVKEKCKMLPDAPKVVLIMIVPPDMKELEHRLAGRNSETEEERQNRLERVKYELAQEEYYDYIVVNDDLIKAKETLQKIINENKS